MCRAHYPISALPQINALKVFENHAGSQNKINHSTFIKNSYNKENNSPAVNGRIKNLIVISNEHNEPTVKQDIDSFSVHDRIINVTTTSNIVTPMRNVSEIKIKSNNFSQYFTPVKTFETIGEAVKISLNYFYNKKKHRSDEQLLKYEKYVKWITFPPSDILESQRKSSFHSGLTSLFPFRAHSMGYNIAQDSPSEDTPSDVSMFSSDTFKDDGNQSRKDNFKDSRQESYDIGDMEVLMNFLWDEKGPFDSPIGVESRIFAHDNRCVSNDSIPNSECLNINDDWKNCLDLFHINDNTMVIPPKVEKDNSKCKVRKFFEFTQYAPPKILELPPDISDPELTVKNPRFCKHPGCPKRSRSHGLCISHGGGKRCRVEGCNKSSQGGGLCIRHGGGKRCEVPNCNKSVQSHGRCKSHGGGPRCNIQGCTLSSQGRGLCRRHGGGQRCAYVGCDKGTQRGKFCAIHGGSKLCSVNGCHRNDRGGGFCATHGGGRRCELIGCDKPARRQGRCSEHFRLLSKQN